MIGNIFEWQNVVTVAATTSSTWYCTLAEFKAAAFPTGVVDTSSDDVIEAAIEAASRAIDRYCGRRFYVNAADETRYVSPERTDEIFVEDVVSITTLKTDADGDRTYETTWAATDYDLLPDNAALEGKPYTRIMLAPQGRYSFPTFRKSVEIVGNFGFPTIPADVHVACQIQAVRYFKRSDAPFGVVGSAEMGQLLVMAKLDPDVEMILRGVKKEKYG